MSGFDTIFRGKKDSSQGKEKSSDILQKNIGKKVYRDIYKKREEILSIKPPINLHQSKKISSEERVFRIQDEIRKFGNSLKKRQIGMLILVLFLSFVVYGVGFVLRTEYAVRNMLKHPEIYTTPEKIKDTVYLLWQDYQILGLIADNSPIPIEPLTSYGKILKNSRLLVAQTENIAKMTDNILGWKKISQQESIFPLLDELWEIAENARDSIDTIIQSMTFLTKSDPGIWKKYSEYRYSLNTFLANKLVWYDLLGSKKPTRILILNQNNDELRAGGGFPGTVFVIEFQKGKIHNITFHDIYTIDHTITHDIASPEGINKFRSKTIPGNPIEFRIRDANYFPTFAESAAQINELAGYSKLGKIDLVIGINTKLIADILAITGPLRVKSIPIQIEEKNISLILSMIVEAKRHVNNSQSKGIITVLGDTILNTLIEKKEILSVLKILWNHIRNGEILIASPREDIQKTIDNLHLFDTWKIAKTDFIYPIFTSIGRNKSDRIMRRSLTVKHVNECRREVILTQKHGWNKEVEAQINKMAYDLNIPDKLPILLPVQGGSDNVTYLRFVLPKGSILETNKNSTFKKIITKDPETVIDAYVTTRAGKNSTVSFLYNLPKNLCETETQFIKQAGLKNLTVTVEKNGKILSEKIF